MDYLLKIENLTIVHSKLISDGINPFVQFVKDTYDNYSLVNDINLFVREGEYLGLVGESGSGKTLTVKSILGLIDVNPGIVEGKISYKSDGQKKKTIILSIPQNGGSEFLNNIIGRQYMHSWHCKIKDGEINLPHDFMYKNNHATICAYNSTDSHCDELILNDKHFKESNKRLTLDIFQKHEYVYLVGLKRISRKTKSFQRSTINVLKEKKIPGRHISIILQDPVSFLNPYWSMSRQMINLNKLHFHSNEENVIDNLLSEVKLNTDSFKTAVPRELSGGQGQRAMILLSSITKPKLLIADEPTTGLDVTLKKIVVEKFKGLRKKVSPNLSMIFISHDLGMVRKATDRINVMYKGEIIENCESEKFNNKEGHHPYVTELLGITQSDYVRDNPDNVKMDLLKLGHGCKYYNNCTLTSKNTRCRLVSPPAISLLSNSILLNDDPNQPWVKCWDFLND
jgi:ABC-type dipeptide/oligopeptide/nickel transport system ATPase component